MRADWKAVLPSFFRCGYPPDLLALLQANPVTSTPVFQVYGHLICLLFSCIVLPALLHLPPNTVPPFQPLMGSDSVGIASHRRFPQLRRVAQPSRGVFRWHKKGIGWITPVQAGRSCVCLTNWIYIWRTGRSIIFAAFLRRKCRWGRCWTRSLWKNSIGRCESRQIAQWNLRRCDGIMEP